MKTVLSRAGLCLMIVMVSYLPVFAAPDAGSRAKGQILFDTGVFLYENGDHEAAGERFAQALATDAANPFYNYYMARVYMEKQEYPKAVVHLDRARSSGQEIPGMAFDWAMVHYRLADYATAARLFGVVSQTEPDNAIARYYEGVSQYRQQEYDKALVSLQNAGAMNSSVKPNAAYYVGMCYLGKGDTARARENFAYAADNATDPQTRNAAAAQLKALSQKVRQGKRYGLTAKVEAEFNNNVLLEPADNEALYSNEDDWVFTGLLSGNYDLIRAGNFAAGLGYTHSQSWYADLSEYDLIGSRGDVYARYQAGRYRAALSYRPAYYWINEESYLMRHEIRPSVTAKLSDALRTSLTYAYKRDNNMFNNDRDGHINEGMLRLIYAIPGGIGDLLAGAGYEVNSATHNDYDYDAVKTELAAKLYLPWRSAVTLAGEGRFREYDHVDSIYGVARDDNRYRGSVVFEKDLYQEILSVGAGYTYTDNDSNISDYEYRSHAFKVFVNARL
ncbi:MAG: surface lipoprotein assembly modifier [Thermodesulfobacteriota bacterium]